MNTRNKNFDSSLIYTLQTNNLNSITKRSKIYFKNIEVGEVIDYSLANDFRKVNIKILIKQEYKKLIHFCFAQCYQ